MIHVIAVAQYVSTHLFGIVMAIITSIMVGWVWHGLVFGKLWVRLTRLDTISKEEAMKGMYPGLAANIVMVFVQAALLGRALQILTLRNVGDALIIAVLLWLPFSALVLLNTYVWARRPMLLWVLDALYNLASMLAVASVLYYTL